MAEEQLKHDALEYHEFPTAGKISIAPTNTLRTSATCRSRTPPPFSSE
jgi:malic enzyme